MRGVIHRPAWPAAAVSARCQPAEAAPTPAAKATAGPALSSDIDAATAANDAIVSGFADVMAKKRT